MFGIDGYVNYTMTISQKYKILLVSSIKMANTVCACIFLGKV